MAYANDHDGNFPPSLDALFPGYASNQSLLVSPFKPEEPMGYIYTAGLKNTAAAGLVLIEDKFAPALNHQRIVVYVDGNRAVLKLTADAKER